MSEREETHRKALRFFEELWQRGDHWELDSSEYERARLDRLLEIVADRRYGRALEIGCGSGTFTRRLATVADYTLGVDISPAAVARAREASAADKGVELRVANAMELDLAKEGSWDLIVISETVCYLGWLYPFFDGGRMLLANTSGDMGDALLAPVGHPQLSRHVPERGIRDRT